MAAGQWECGEKVHNMIMSLWRSLWAHPDYYFWIWKFHCVTNNATHMHLMKNALSFSKWKCTLIVADTSNPMTTSHSRFSCALFHLLHRLWCALIHQYKFSWIIWGLKWYVGWHWSVIIIHNFWIEYSLVYTDSLCFITFSDINFLR